MGQAAETAGGVLTPPGRGFPTEAPVGPTPVIPLPSRHQRRRRLVAAALAVALLVVLATVLVVSTALDHLDLALDHRLLAAMPDYLLPQPYSVGYERALSVAEIGDGQIIATIALIAAAAAALATRTWRPVWASALVLTVLVVLVEGGKHLLGRASPGQSATDPHRYGVGGASFPSGHASGTLVVFGLVAALLCGPAGVRPSRAAHAGLTVLACAVSAAVGWCTVVLAWHWPSDVVGGWLLGGALLIVANLVLVGPAP